MPSAAVFLPSLATTGMHLPAHVLSGGVAWWLDALLYVAAAAGVALAVATRVPRTRKLGVALAAAGVGLTLLLGAVVPGSPRSPGYVLRLLPAGGATVTSPVLLRLCAWYPSGLAAAVPGGGEVLSVSVDGVERLTATAPTAAVDVPPGRHTVRVQVLTSAHVAYTPASAVQNVLSVTGTAPLPRAPSCPAQPPTPSPGSSP
jgi:hypothetical protein